MQFEFLRYLIIFAASASILAPVASFACSCMPIGTVQQEQAKSTLVFRGHVSAIEQRSSQMDKNSLTLAWEWVAELFGTEKSKDSAHRYQRVAFEVKQTLKGSTTSNVELSTGMGGGDCGYEFELDKEYWVYARGTDATLTVSICSLTGPTKPHTK